MFCALLTSRYQVSVYRTNGPLVSFLFHYSMEFIKANRSVPDGTPRFAASHPGLFCVPMTHKKNAGLIWI